MKKLIIIVICCLLLTGCVSVDDVREMEAEWESKYLELEEEWSVKYYELENKYESALSDKEDLELFINGIDEISLDLYQYFDDKTISFDKAHSIFDQLRSEFIDYYSE